MIHPISKHLVVSTPPPFRAPPLILEGELAAALDFQVTINTMSTIYFIVLIVFFLSSSCGDFEMDLRIFLHDSGVLFALVGEKC